MLKWVIIVTAASMPNAQTKQTNMTRVIPFDTIKQCTEYRKDVLSMVGLVALENMDHNYYVTKCLHKKV